MSVLPRIVSVALFGLSVAHIGNAQTAAVPEMAQIEQAWADEDFVTVRNGLQQLAEQTDDPDVHYRYGRVLAEGRGGPRDVAGAVKWLEKSVAQNHSPAATLLARILLSSQTLSDPERAASLFEGAAARGDHEAQYYLGLLYQSGRGVDQNDSAAFRWFLAASEGQNVEAQWLLSKAYAAGVGTVQNTGQALKWMEAAANGGQQTAQYFLGVAYDQGTAIARNPKTALEWYQRAGKTGHVQAQLIVGLRYLNGADGIPANGSEAQRWLNAAANGGSIVASYHLGVGYSDGTVLPLDETRARILLEGAALEEFPPAPFALGQLHEGGRGVPADLQKAVQLYMASVKLGFEPAAQYLGALTSKGMLDDVVAPHTAVPWALLNLRETQNPDAQAWLLKHAKAGVRPAQAALGAWMIEQEGLETQGADFVQKAAFAGDVPSQFLLGSMFATGTNLPLDYVKAHMFLNIAAASGHQQAADMRDLMNDLMTPDEVAVAQTLARDYLDGAAARAPQTEQTQSTVTPDQDQ